MAPRFLRPRRPAISISDKICFIIQSMPKRSVVLGLVGTTIDRGTGTRRWEGWRPSIAVCQHEDLLVDRFELLHPRGFTSLAARKRQICATCDPVVMWTR